MRKAASVILLLLVAMRGIAQTEPIPSEAVRNYLQGRTAAMQTTATEKDVELALSGLAENAVYEHRAFKARIEGRDKMRQGMLGHIGGTRNARFEVKKSISTATLVVVEMQLSFEAEKDGKWLANSRRQVFLFD